MPVQSIECQLVRAQIGRYLGGEPLSQEAMRQLEVHLVACDDCRAALASRKSDLRAKMSLENAAKKQRSHADPLSTGQRAAVDYKAIEAAAASVGSAGVDAAKRTRPNAFVKPLVLTAGLGVVLFAMSRMSGGNGLSFGTTALSAFAANAATPVVKTSSVKPAQTPAAAPAQPAATLAATPPPATAPAPADKPATPPTSAPATSTSAPIPGATTTTSQPAAAPTASSTTTAPAPTSPAKDTAPQPSPTAAPAKTLSTATPAKPEVKPAPVVEQPKALVAEKHSAPASPVHVVHRRVKARKAARRRALALRAKRARKKAHRGASARVRVYDASGAPLN